MVLNVRWSPVTHVKTAYTVPESEPKYLSEYIREELEFPLKLVHNYEMTGLCRKRDFYETVTWNQAKSSSCCINTIKVSSKKLAFIIKIALIAQNWRRLTICNDFDPFSWKWSWTKDNKLNSLSCLNFHWRRIFQKTVKICYELSIKYS